MRAKTSSELALLTIGLVILGAPAEALEEVVAKRIGTGELTDVPDEWDPTGWEGEQDLPIPVGTVLSASSVESGGADEPTDWGPGETDEWDHLGGSDPDPLVGGDLDDEGNPEDPSDHYDDDGNWVPGTLPESSWSSHQLTASATPYEANLSGWAFDSQMVTASSTGQQKAAAGVTTTFTNRSDQSGSVSCTLKTTAKASLQLKCFTHVLSTANATASGATGGESMASSSIDQEMYATAKTNLAHNGSSVGGWLLEALLTGKPNFGSGSTGATSNPNGDTSDEGPLGPSTDHKTAYVDSVTIHNACRVVGELHADGGGIVPGIEPTYGARAHITGDANAVSWYQVRLGVAADDSDTFPGS